MDEVLPGDSYKSLPMRGAWIEIELVMDDHSRNSKSLPMRGAWIEIVVGMSIGGAALVAPHAGSVD